MELIERLPLKPIHWLSQLSYTEFVKRCITKKTSKTDCESLYTSLASDVNIYRLAGTVSFANSGQPVTTVGVAITKPEMNGTFTSTNVLAPSLTPVTACANSNIINCGF